MSETTLELQIRDNAAAAASGLQKLESVLVRIKNAADIGTKLSNVADGIAKITNAMQTAIPEENVSRIERLASALERLSKAGGIKIPNARGMMADATQGVQAPLESAQRTIQGVMETAQEGAQAINKASQAIGSLNARGEAAANNGMRNLINRFREITRTARSANRPLHNLLSSFLRIARIRLIRAAIKEIAQGFKEGLENVKAYSKAIGSGYYTAMQSANAATLKMKNSLGAALAPALQALVPLLKIVVNWVITAANAFNQLVSLVTGASTWTRAIDPSEDLMEKLEGSATGADKAIKNLLADWDELNIIQSKTNGSGSGSNKLVNEDYLNMFEQVDVFDSKIRQVSEFIKQNWDTILNDVKLIGAAILAWEISPLFGGVLSTLAALGVFGVTVKLTWDMALMLNNEYLETKEPGWLLADVLTTALGSFVGVKALSLAGFNFSWVAVPITLIVSATAGLVATIGKTDVSALEKENLISTIENAAKAGIAAGYLLYKTTDLTKGEATAAGVGGALITFGVAIGIKAVAQSVKDGKITSETFKAEALSAVGIATGVATVARAFGVTDMSRIIKIGGGAMLASVGLMVGVKALVDAANSEGIDSENFLEAALSAVGIGVGAGLLGSSFGLSGGNAALLGGGMALGAVGMYLAVNVIASAKDSTNINGMTFIKSALAAVGIGGSVSLLAAALGVGNAVTIGAIAGGAVLGALSLYVGIKLLTSKDDIEWGNEKLTKEQVQAFVDAEMFNVDVHTSVSLIKERIDTSKIKKEVVKRSLAEALGTFEIIKLGVDEESSLTEAISQVNTLISDIEAYAETQTAILKTGVSVIPVLNEAGENISAEVLSQGITGWSEVTSYMSGLGTELSNALIDSTTGKLKTDWDAELVNTLLDKISNVSRAVLGAQMSSGKRSELYNGLYSLGDLNKETFTQAMDYFSQYISELRSGYTEIYQEEIASFEALAAYYDAMAENEADNAMGAVYKEKAQEAAARAKELRDMLLTNVSQAVDAATKPGRDMINEWLETSAKDALQNLNIPRNFWGLYTEKLGRGMNKNAAINSVIADLAGIPRDVFTMLGTSGLDYLSEETREKIESIIEENERKIQELLNNPDDSAYALPAVDGSKMTGSLDQTATDVESTANRIRTAIASLSGVSFGFTGSIFGGKFSVSVPAVAAEGGMFTTGQMFIAREAGPEMVGNIGRRSAVANNDQIVSGIAGGVAAGQEEQNALLRQQNDYLRKILAKEGSVTVKPSAEWGGFNRKSNEMYERNTGVSV